MLKDVLLHVQKIFQFFLGINLFCFFVFTLSNDKNKVHWYFYNQKHTFLLKDIPPETIVSLFENHCSYIF